jgi:hypothetical protein
MTYEFFPEAREELFEAALYYEAREEGLGMRFRNDVASAIESILKDPFIFRERGGYRRYNLTVFPHYIAYFVEGAVLMIAAVAHSAREPNYWKERLGKQ